MQSTTLSSTADFAVRFSKSVSRFVAGHPVPAAAAFLVIAQAIICIGIRDAGIPIGDEGVHILRALAVGWHPRTWASPFHDAYALLLLFIPDPIIAHLFLRFVLAEVTLLVLWRLLLSAGLSLRASTTAAILWLGCGLGNVPIQVGNLNLFTFAIAASGVSLLLKDPTPRRKGICFALLMLASASRAEYLAPAAVLVLIECAKYLIRINNWKRWAILAVGMAIAAALVIRVDFGFLDRYLLLGLGQCYAVFIRRQNPEMVFDPMTEFSPLLDSVFGNPHGFFEAAWHNPGELFRYLALNGLRNGAMIGPALLNPKRAVTLSSINAEGIASLMGVWTALAIGAWLAIGRTGGFRDLKGKVGTLSLLASAPSVSILLLIPEPRYWIGVVPLLYACVAVATEALWSLKLPSRLRKLAVLAACIWLISPMPWSRNSNQADIHAARDALAPRSHPVIGAIFPEPWVAFATRGAAEGRDFEKLSHNPDWSLEGMDLVVVDDSLRGSKIWRDHPSRFAVLQSPAYCRVHTRGSLELYARH
jgi:hypothetical protein